MTFNQQLKQTQEKVKRDTEVFNKYGYKSDLLMKMDEIKKSHVNRSGR